ncbi:hypothetical protein K2173_023003 [Erythroxylum novogranatense]|uniref:Myb-like domain-containing protein n=1 Tax=Erythroxylum novogranatense TaxID=1862640 RepID=A0AAV8T997_9ROSI|nr:hypothetical protein K2173_023003 [Erythroxylum novogranatense]
MSMLGDSSTMLATSGDVADPVAVRVHEGGGGGGVGPDSGDEDRSVRVVDEGDRLNYGANRWPRQETLALLKIRSDMDAVFRDSSHKGPLWEEVSRKLAELGYSRSAKKCKEKFENVYKYHKRTKEGRTGKSEGKTYRFFDQLQALESHNSSQRTAAPPSHPPQSQTSMAGAATLPSWPNAPNFSHFTVPSTAIPVNVISGNTVTSTTNPTMVLPLSSSQPVSYSQNSLPSSFQNLSAHLFSSSTSSSTASDEDLDGSGKRKRKRKWKDFFQRLTKDVLTKQEELQRRLLETIDKREHERMAREEAWRMQEMARINREHDILIQERSAAVTKDAAVIAFLKKISGQQIQENPQPLPQPAPPPPQPRPRPPPAESPLVPITNLNAPEGDNGEDIRLSSSSRWPKAEVEALIRLRTSLDTKYQQNGPKAPLWEEISAGMQRLGYNRSAKRCKEKWENINKYFKKVKESSKHRLEDSKTCPYFHQLDALYKEKSKIEGSINTGDAVTVKHVSTMEPLMVRPERQWPLQQESQVETAPEDRQREKIEDDIEEDEEEEEDRETEEEDEAGGFEMVANKPATLGNGE